jgi:hypothetical protein
MDDEVRVRIPHCIEYLPEQFDASSDVEIALCAVVEQGQAI